MSKNLQLVIGIDSSSIVYPFSQLSHIGIHQSIVSDLEKFLKKIAEENFRPVLVSGYRNYEKQKLIWEEKFQGIRPVLDLQENPLDIKKLSEEERIWAILNWSAIPGGSRHHWGYDFDLVAFKAEKENQNYKIALTQKEWLDSGPFRAFGDWIQTNLTSTPFYRPYFPSHNKIADEPWHFSHQSSSGLKGIIQKQDLINLWEDTNLLGKETLIKNIDQIFQDYID